MKQLLVLLSAALLFLASCVPNAEQHEVAVLVNQSRQAHGLGPLTEDYTARNKAQNWANYLAAREILQHSVLHQGMEGIYWMSIGENIGRGTSIEAVHSAYLLSPSHKANIMGDWCCIGTGVARSADGTIYTVQVFFRL